MRATFSAFLPILLRLFAVLLMLLAGGLAVADTTFLMNGKSSTGLVFENYAWDKGRGDFFYRLIGTKGKLEGKQASLEVAQVLTVEFREPDDTEKTPKGRVANVTLADGKIANHLIVEAFLRGKAGAVFRFRKTGVAPGGKTIELAADKIRTIDFGIPDLSLIGDPQKTDKIRKAPRDGDLANVLQEAPPDPAAQAPADTAAAPSAPMTENEQWSQFIGADKVYGNNNPLTEGSAKKQKKTGMFQIGDAKTASAIEAIGLFMVLCLLGVIVLLTFVVGTFVLLFTAKNAGINDLTVPRAIATSALLAFVPPGLFFACLMVPVIMCSIKLTAGIFLWWLSAKMIVGGMLEVVEGKATDILISFYLMLVMFGCIFWIWALNR